MALQLDHFFILTEAGAPTADKLIAAGIAESPCNNHPGQGTANRRFFLNNTTIELLYIRSEEEARTGPGSRLRFADRYRDSQASPFGLVVRTDQTTNDPPFESWRYYPDYFGPDMCFFVGSNSDTLVEPLCICMPPLLPRHTQPPAPGNEHWDIQELVLSVPVSTPSPTLSVFSKCKGVSIVYDQPHHLRLRVSNGLASGQCDLSPAEKEV